MAYVSSLSGSKLRNKLGASLNEEASAPTSDFARQQLQKMGWTDGVGLGKRKQGIKTHIVAKKREENVGLGHSAYGQQNNSAPDLWWSATAGDTLAKLAANKKKKKKKKGSSSDKDEKNRKRHFTDEELFERTGGARFGMRAQRRATGKWARTEKVEHDVEQEALARVEWNGRGSAKLLLSSDTEGKTADENESSDDKTSAVSDDYAASQSNTTNTCTEVSSEKCVSEKKRKKKDRKKEKKKKKEKKRQEA